MSENMTEQAVAEIKTTIENDVAGVADIRVTITNHVNEETEHVTRWVAVWNGYNLLFTINSLEEWNMIYALFERMFSGPTAAEVDQMEKKYNSQDCVF